MIIFKQSEDLRSYLQKLTITKRTVAFVPTMGALHNGHISLITKSKEIATISVCSIFINPTQFNNTDDFKKYPVTIEQDIYLLEKNGCDILFLPAVDQIYPGPSFSKETFDLEYLETMLEGTYRPGHFQGVCMVVKRLLQIVNPQYLLAGQKDYQQCLVLKKLLQLINLQAELVICPTSREKDGLAMSSRNLRLNEPERMMAPAIYQAMQLIRQQMKPGNLSQLKSEAVSFLSGKKFAIDYIEIANAYNLQPVDSWDGNEPLIILVAAYIHDVRLIDNLAIPVEL